jgi:hypothetical protein
MSFPYIIQGSMVTVVIDNRPHTISKTHITYQKVVDAIKANDWDAVRDLIEPKQLVINYGAGNISIQGQELKWKGTVMHNALSQRMVTMLQEGFPIDPLAAFMDNLMLNPSKRAVDELYGFLEKNSLPITPDGHFLAYKKVRRDYLDIHSGTMDNSVGQTVEMARNQVDDNKDQTCSTGLHFCSQEYLPHFGNTSSDRVVIVKINPRDVVSIPSDYNNAKGRACRYEVVGEIGNDGQKIDSAFTQSVQANAANNIAQPVAAAPAAPKTGTGPFYQGYSDGWNNQPYGTLCPPGGRSVRLLQHYSEGFTKGQADRKSGTERYRYVAAMPWPTPQYPG